MRHSGLTFYLNGEYVYASYYAADGRATPGIGLKVDRLAWQAGRRERDEAALLRRLQRVIDVYEVDCRQAGRPTVKAEVEALIYDATGKKPKPKANTESFLAVYMRVVRAVEAGEILFRGKKYSDSWVRTAKIIYNAIHDFPLAQLPAERITEAELMAFDAALTGKGMYRRRKNGDAPTKYGAAKNTVSTYMSVLIGILNKARRKNWHGGTRLDTVGVKSSSEDIDHGQYLNQDAEQLAIKALPYTGIFAAWRNTYLFGCRVGMRFSDLERLTPQHRHGNNLNINTKKTGNPVWVPLDGLARQIWAQYGGTLLVPPRHTFLPFIRKMGREAGLDKPVLFSRTEGGVKVERWVKKWELLGTHTMRRSFATNAYRAGVPMLSIMKVTGHRSTGSFLKYIRLSDEEHAQMLSEHAHFQ